MAIGAPQLLQKFKVYPGFALALKLLVPMEGIDYSRKLLNLRVSWLRSGRVTPIAAPRHSAPIFHRRNFLRGDFITEAAA
ncbi:MAG: hypothetical protein ABI579_08635 [Candidatus Sumerlaeota bacterium]